MVPRYDLDNLRALANNGGAIFTAAGTFSGGNGPIAVATGDVNGDGKLDVVVANRLADSLTRTADAIR